MKPTVLCILDGLGINPSPDGNAVAAARTPVLDNLFETCPHTSLITFGEAVGLPAGQMGNSEVGHLNIGAGRVVEQWLLRINRALSGDFLDTCEPYQRFLKKVHSSGGELHLAGLFSDGGVHSHSEHLYLLLERLKKDVACRINLHLFTDGRDTPPKSSAHQIEVLNSRIGTDPRLRISTITGRFYAMDRDKRWERTKIAADAIMLGEGKPAENPVQAIHESYKRRLTDEFLEPIIVNHSAVGPNDCILFWNFREDRMRQLPNALCSEHFEGFDRKFPPFTKDRALSFTDYDPNLHIPYIFDILNIKNHLGEWLAAKELKQLRVAETEKYPHVTYFFNGGIEQPYPGEERIVIPSPRDVKTYDQKPEMSAYEVCQTVLDGIDRQKYALIVVNFANCDMVGHSGVLEAATKAVEVVDECLGKILTKLREYDGQAVIIADHGNAEQMTNPEDGAPFTAHTTFPVPVIIYGNSTVTALKDGLALRDVAPTLLKLMNIAPPPEMTGQPLF